MKFDHDTIRLALSRVPNPATPGKSIVDAGIVEKISYCDANASVRLAGGGLHEDQRRGLMQHVSAAVRLAAQQSGVDIDNVHVEFTGAVPAHSQAHAHKPQAPSTNAATPAPQTPALPNVRHIIAVGAGKGGVGKSTIAVNLAVGLARRGHAVGLMDGDIYGPSIPTMLGLSAHEAIVREGVLQPFFVHGVKCMTIGKLVDAEKPLIWRGPMAHGAFKQLVEQTAWGELDYLIIDLPPGTGDVALTMAQMLKLTGAVVVCTPQRVAQDDAIRALRMFQQLSIEVLGVVENMSSFIADNGKDYDIFGKGGAQMMAQRTGVPFLGALPITMSLRANSDSGNPSANFDEASPPTLRLRDALDRLITNIENQAALASMKLGTTKPQLSIS